MNPIFKKELKSTLSTPLSYIIIAIFIGLLNFLFLKSFFISEILSLRGYFDLLLWFMIIFIPALSMKIFADEFKNWTIEYLLTKPVKIACLVMGKFFSLIAYFSLFILSTVVLYYSTSWLWDTDVWMFISQLVWLFLLSTCMFSVSFFASAITINQVFAFIIAVTINFGFVLTWLDFIQSSVPFGLANILMQISFPYHFNNFLMWLISLADVFYFLTIIAICLYLAYLSIVRYQTNQKVWLNVFKWVEILLTIWIFIFLNLIAWRLYVSADLTKNKIHTISDWSKEILWEIDDLVDVNFYVSEELPPTMKVQYQSVKDKLNQFKSLSHNNLIIREIHPDVENKESEAQQNWVYPVQANIIENDQFAVKKIFFWVSMKYKSKSESVPFLWQSNNLEHLLVSKLLKITSNKSKSIFLLTTNDINQNQLADLNEVFSRDYEVHTQAASSWSDLMYKDDAIWLLVMWNEDYPDAFYKELENQVDKPKTIIVLAKPFSVNPESWLVATRNVTKMEDFLKSSFGTEFWNGIVWDVKDNSQITFRQWFMTYMIPYPYFIKSSVNQDLPIWEGVNSIVLPFATNLKISSNKYKVEKILTTSDSAFIQTNLNALWPDDKSSIDTNNLHKEDIWATLSKDDFSFTIIPWANMIDFIKWEQNNSNLAFMSNIVDWLGWDKRLIKIRAKQIENTTFKAEESIKNIIKAINIWILPFILVITWIITSLVISSRRK